jgi:hypothetical protein
MRPKMEESVQMERKRNHEDHRHLILDLMEGIPIRMVLHHTLIIRLDHILVIHTHILLRLHQECLQLIMEWHHLLQCPLLLSTGDNTTLQSSMIQKQLSIVPAEDRPFILFLHR